MKSTRLTACRFCVSAIAFLPLVSFSQVDSPPNAPITLTNLQQVSNLTNELASAHYQAHVRALVVHVWAATRRIYLQEGGRGLEVGLPSSASPYRPGQMVEVTGTVQPALPRPRIAAASVTVITNIALSRPRASSANRLIGGQDPFGSCLCASSHGI